MRLKYRVIVPDGYYDIKKNKNHTYDFYFSCIRGWKKSEPFGINFFYWYIIGSKEIVNYPIGIKIKRNYGFKV
jgi:hypothetical protein